MSDFSLRKWVNSNYDLILFFFFSYFISSLYMNGDQYFYSKNYREIQNLDLLSAFRAYQQNLSTREPVYFIFSYFFSKLNIPKEVFCSIANCILFAGLKKYFFEINVRRSIVYLILYTNFYLLVLYFAADRLKLSCIFLLFWFLSSSKLKNGYLILSIFAHVQSLIILVGIYIASLKKLVPFTCERFAKYIIFTLFFLVIAYLLREHMLSKFLAYFLGFEDRFNPLEYLKLLLMFYFSWRLTRNHFLVVALFFPIFVALFLFGPDRVNMIGYLVMMYFGLLVNRGINFPVLATLCYMAIKGVFFYLAIFITGDGFDNRFSEYLSNLNFLH